MDNIVGFRQAVETVCIATMHGKYVGKLIVEDQDFLKVESVAEVQQILTNQGTALIVTVLGTANFDKKACTVFILDKKSPLYIQYLQATSGLTVPHGKM